jgi:hypothetical protein
MNTLALVTRAYDAEAPYIRSFIDYYRSRNINEFHIVIPKVNPCDLLIEQLSAYPDVMIHRDYCVENETDIESLRNVALPHIKATHILNVDVDEYLDVDDVTPLLVDDYIKLEWTIAPYSDTGQQRLLSFRDRQCKYIVKASICASLEDHYCQLNAPVPQVISPHQLIHYVYRSFTDIYLKCACSSYSCYQKTEKWQLDEGVNDIIKLPHKFKVAAVYRRLVLSSEVHRVPNYCRPDVEVEQLLLEKYRFSNDIDGLYDAYLRYCSRLNMQKFLKEIAKTKEYKTTHRLPHFLLSVIADKCLDHDIAKAFYLPGSVINSVVSKLFFK